MVNFVIGKYESDLQQITNESTDEEERFRKYKEQIENLNEQLRQLEISKGDINTLIDEKNAIIEEQGKRLAQVKLEKTDREIEFNKLQEVKEDYKNKIEKPPIITAL